MPLALHLHEINTRRLRPRAHEYVNMRACPCRLLFSLLAFAVAYRTATACISMNEMPYIRYSSSARGISEVVARALAKSLTGYMKENPSFKPWGDPRSRADDDPVGELCIPYTAVTLVCDDPVGG